MKYTRSEDVEKHCFAIDNLLKLRFFLTTAEYKSLSLDEQMLLNSEAKHLNAYTEVLGARIKLFDDSKDKIKSSLFDNEIKREDAVDRHGHTAMKSVESITVISSKYKRDIRDFIGFITANFDTCLGIANHIRNTRDTESIDFSDIFKFVERQIDMELES